MKKYLFILCLSIASLLGISQTPNLSSKAQFSVLTVAVANESHSLYGHTALRVKDPVAGFDVVYNYGMFDFKAPHFLLKFTKGDLQYYAAVYPFTDFEYSYQQDNRSFYEQKLNLNNQEKQLLYEKLNHSVFTEERFYTYKFIDRNCTTKVVDIINSVLKDRPIQNKLNKNKSYREVLYAYQANQYWLNLGINLIFGSRPDEPAKKLFLPLDLMKTLETTLHHGKPLSEKPKTLFIAAGFVNEFSFWNSYYPLIMGLLLIVFLNKRLITTSYFTVIGFLGVFLISVSLYSLHKEVLWNYNILLFNPFLLFVVYFGIRKNNKVLRLWVMINLALLIIYLVYLFNKIHFILMVPIAITHLIFLSRLLKGQKTNN